MSRVSHHIRSNVYGLVALFIVLAGTAYAADGPLPGQNQVGSADIINGEVLAVDVRADQIFSSEVRDDTLPNGGLGAIDLQADSVGTSEVDDSLTGADVSDTNSLETAEIDESTLFNDNSLTGADVASESLSGSDITNLTGSDIADNFLTGSDVNESTLGTVPNANEVDGVSARSFEYSSGDGGVTTIVLNMGGMALKADCDPFNGNTRVELFADSSVDNSTLYAVDNPLVEGGSDTTLVSDFDASAANAQLIQADASPALEVGKGIVFFRGGSPGGTDASSDDVLTVNYAWEAGGNCAVYGTAVGGPSS